MQISDIARQYAGTTSSPEAVAGTRGVEKLVSSIRDLTAGNIFEGTVNMVQDGKVVLGLSNGTLINARLDAGMQLTQGQSMFFQVKSNTGETIAIRPYTVGGSGANLTLLNALNAAGLPVTDKYLNLANNLMQEQMPIDKNTMSQMARILMANPDMSVNSLVQMKKLNLPITNEMVAQFENYVDDSSAVHKALDSFITELPTTMAGKDLPLEQLKAFDSQLLMIIADGMEGTQPNGVQSAVSSQTFENPALGETVVQLQQISGQEGKDQTLQMTQVQDVNTQQVSAQDANSQKVLVQEWFPNQIFSQEATPETAEVQGTINENVANQNTDAQTVILQGENVIVAEKAIVDTSEATGTNSESIIKDVTTQTDSKENVVRLMNSLFGELGISDNDSSAVILNKLSHFILTSNTVSKEALQELFSSKDMQQFLRDALESQMYLTPEDVADAEKVKKLYERLESKTQRLESLLNQVGLQETPLAQTISEVRGNVEFMNQLNQAYTYVQIPLKMAGQNASGQLYVYTKKRDLSDPEKELSAFLHLDLDHLGATDVSVKMLRKKVDTKFYMETDEAFELVKAHMPELEERLRLKGFDAKIYVENEGKKVNFLDDFLKKDAPPTGQLHRYSFDVRA